MWAILFAVLGLVGWSIFLRKATRAPDELPIRSESDAEVDKLACILTNSFARMHIQFGVRGCFDGPSNLLDLEVGPQGAIARGWGTAGADPFREISPVSLPLPEGRRHLAELVAAARRKESSTSCKSTTSLVARVYYWCGPEKRGPLMLTAPMCDPEFLKLVGNKRQSLAYARARGVSTAAEEILSKLPGKEVSGPAKADRASGKWGTPNRDGRRDLHDPVEDWSDP